MEKLRWGILGTGNIARTLAKAVKASQTGVLTGVGSRTAESAEKFGAEFDIPGRYASYRALLEDPAVDAVYISLPNHLHAEWTIACAAAGKHILCEKPFTTNHAEAMRVLDEVRHHDVFLMEAFMYRCHPQTQRLKDLINERTIGDVRLIESNFCYNMGPQYENIRLSNPAAGGGVMDVGCYTMSMARLIAGCEPEQVRAVAHIGPVSRVDEWSVASVQFKNGIAANLACATQVSADSELRIWGSQGSIRVPNPWFPGESGNRILVQRSGQPVEEIVVEGGGGLYSIEVDTVARYIADRQAPAPCMTWDDTNGNMAALDAWRKSIGLVFDVEKTEALAGPPPPVRRRHAMKYGKVAGVESRVSRLVMGSMVFHPDNMPFCCSMLDHFVSIGGNCIDTALVYGGAERAVGNWMRLRGNRDQIVLIGKGAHHDARGPRVNPECIAADMTESLAKLQTDYLDLYMLHRDDPTFPVGEIVECLNLHLREGRIRSFGGSNWSTGRIEAANEYATKHGLVGFAASSPNFSLATPNVPRWAGCSHLTTADREWHRKTQIPVFGWSSQAGGFFTGRFRQDSPDDPEMVRVWYSAENFEKLRRAQELGAEKGVTALQVALAYVLNQPFPTFALIGPRTVEETRTTAEGLTVKLSPEEIAWLELED